MRPDTEDILIEIKRRLSSPSGVLGESTGGLEFVETINGGTLLAYDQLSYENGAPGIIVASAALGWNDLVGQYGKYVQDRLPMFAEQRGPDPVGDLYGVYLTSHLLAARSDSWTRVASRTSRLLHDKLLAYLGLIDHYNSAGEPLPSFLYIDVLRGISRDTQLLLRSNAALLIDRELVDISRVLSDVLNGEGGLPCWISGPPFSEMPFEIPAHWNFGTAHGATGVAFALLAVSLEAERRGIKAVDGRRQIRLFVKEMIERTNSAGPPSYAFRNDERIVFSDPHTRPSWCYGLTGLHLLILALSLVDGDMATTNRATQTLSRLAQHNLDEFEDEGLCHGTAGLLVALTLSRLLTGEGEREIALLRERIQLQYDPSHPFCFAYTSSGLLAPASIPGLLTGSTGIAWALRFSLTSELNRRVALGYLIAQCPWIQL